jgi:hypothetical protein
VLPLLLLCILLAVVVCTHGLVGRPRRPESGCMLFVSALFFMVLGVVAGSLAALQVFTGAIFVEISCR